ncbi:hypothetical protein ABEW05_001310 [Botrytis cinerea]
MKEAELGSISQVGMDPEFSVRQVKRRKMSQDASLDEMYDAVDLVTDRCRLKLSERTIWTIDCTD